MRGVGGLYRNIPLGWGLGSENWGEEGERRKEKIFERRGGKGAEDAEKSF